MTFRHAVLISLCAVLALGCPGQKPAVVASKPIVKPAPDSGDGWRLSKSGLGFRLSEADENAGKDDRPLAKTTPLSEADTKKVLDRMPKLAAEPDDAKEFALRAKSLPAPRTGKTISETFPPPLPPQTAPQVAAGPLTIARKAPEGPVDLAPRLSVSFSQPMVPITSMDDLSKTPPPVKLTPQPPGKWRWIGTQTVLFDPDPKDARNGAGGFPMATEYQVEVPAGTASQTGGKLAAAEKWTFTTPPPKVVQSFPSHGGAGGPPVGLEPLIYLAFDQAIDPAAMLKSIDVSANPGKRITLRLADADEVEKDNRVRSLSKAAIAGRWLAFRATERLPAAATIVVKVKTGAPSAEGPRTTDRDQVSQFQTFGPLKITQHRCGWDKTCPPLMPWYVEFSNPIDLKGFDKKMVKVDPELPGMKITASGQSITLSGRAKGKTSYKVTFASAVPDIFDQTLGKDETVTFDVGPAVPALFAEDKEMMVNDPAGGGKVPVFSVNQPGIRVRVYAVKPEDFRRYQEWRRAWDYERKNPEPPGRLVTQTTLKPTGAADSLSETAIDLAPALTKGVGQVIVIAEGTAPPRYPGQRDWFRSWVQVTGIGLDAVVDAGEALAWTTSLSTGAPLANVDIAVFGGNPVKSSADGLARLPLAMAGEVLTARVGNDVAFIHDPYGRGFTKAEQTDQVRWFVFDDRKTYKPGEEVRIKGWVRRAGMGKGGDLGFVTGAKTATWRVTDPRNNEIGKGTSVLDASGGLDATFKLPDAANLGYAQVHLHLEGASGVSNIDHTHGFSVQEFRRPEFEVNAQAPAGPHYVGGNTVATVAATYYAGGGLPSAAVDWRVTRSDASFTPPNRSEYSFGRGWLGWGWMQARSRSKKRVPGESNEPPPTTETWTSKTDAMGKHRLRIDFDALDPPYAMDLALQASVTDVNRQAWTARASVLVHPASEYVGLKQQKAFVRAGESIQVDAIVVDVDGKTVAGRTVTLESARIDFEQEGEEFVEKEKDKASCALTSTDAPQKCALSTKDGGRYRITAIVTDAKGRRSRTDTETWVVSDTMPKDRDLAAGAVKIIADKKEYKAGDTAELLVMGAFAPAEGVLTIARQGMVEVQRFSMRGSTATLKVKIDPSWVPNVIAHVQLAGSAPRENEDGEPDAKLPKQPAFGAGTIGLAIPPEGRTLKVDVSPREPKIEPGGTTEITLDVKEPGGKPAANATLAVVVVDEAILALSGYKLPDPLATFYSSRTDGVRTIALRSFVTLARPDVARLSAPGGLQQMRGYGGEPMMDSVAATGGAMPPPMMQAPMPAASASAAPTTPSAKPSQNKEREESNRYSEGTTSNANIAVRQDFTPIAAFIPRVVTDASGKAKVPVKLPDNLTRYRIMAIAVAGENKFGSGESTVTARLPLMVRPSAPRFLNFGDKFELPVVVQNQTDQPMTVDIAARASNAEVEAAGKRVTVPPNDRVEVRLLASAVKAGTARFQVGAASGKWADANQLELPVWTPATTEAFATYGEIDQGGITQPVKMPPNVVTQFGGLEITTSSTSLQALTDAVLYLVRYPYECNEQLASRILAIAALKDVLTAFQAKGLPAPEVLVATVKKDIERLAARQGYDGGWGFWQRGDTSWPYLGIHVAHALVRAKEKGFDVPANLTARSQSYLKQIEQHIPGWYPIDERRSLVAYALFVRTLMNDVDRPRAKRLIAEAGGADKLQMEANGWLLRVLTGDAGSQGELTAIRKHLANRATETAGAAHFTTNYKDGEHLLLSSDRRADGVILDSLIVDQPNSTLIPKVVAGLLAHRTAGRWTNTQENAFVLLALDRYFRTYEKTTPDFVARAWLGNTLAGEHAFKGRTTERYAVNVPMQLLATQAAQGGGGSNIVLAKDGPGRMYFRIGMQYAPADLKPPPTDHGFTVTRSYEGVDAPGDVRRDADGTWRVKAGTKVRVRLGMVVPSRRYHVALVDPIPAGLEPMNAALAVTGAIPQDPKEQANASRWWWSRTWYEHQNLRDERVEAFASLVWEGVYDYTYVARATTPGTFVVPPPKAEEMYSPETFGRGAGDRLIVE